MTATTAGIFVNGRDFGADFGLILDEATGPWDALQSDPRTVDLPDRMGNVSTSPNNITRVRTAKLQGKIVAASRAALLSTLDAIKFYLDVGLLEIRYGDSSAARCWFMQLRTMSVIPYPGKMESLGARLDLEFVSAEDPLGYDVAPQDVSFGATLVPMPLGTAAVAPRIFLFGAATNPVLTYADASGGTISTLTLTGSLAAGEYLDIDNLRQTIYKVDVSNVRTNARSWLTGGSYLTLQPSYGDQPNAVYPQLKVSSGTALATYFRGWL